MKLISLKNALLHFMILSTALFFLAACGKTKPVDTEKLSTQENKARIDDNSKEKDAQFMVDVAALNLEIAKLSLLAQQKGVMADVKDLAVVEESMHDRAMKDLVALANKKVMNIPTTSTNDAMEAYDKLNGMSGSEFDKAFCKRMIDLHQDMIDKCEKASKDATDHDIKDWARGMVPGLQQHLDQAKACEKKMDGMI
jgi:putative membrane protein